MASELRVAVTVGTRPEIIKMAPVILELDSRGISYDFIYSGQHYDYELSMIFIEELGLPTPHERLVLESRRPAAQIGEMMIKLESVLRKRGKHDVMLIQGDTNTMLAAGLTALKLGMKLGHVEAGLRSFDWRMPEEHNRRMIDHVSDYLYAPTERARQNLLNENVYGNIVVTGNTVIDALERYYYKVKEVESEVISKIEFSEYILMTVHRAENVDDPYVLRNIVTIIEKSPMPIVLPIHPRTRRRLIEYGLWHRVKSIKHLQILPPQGYFEFLALMKNSSLVLTDSGGVQEEATYPKLRKRVLVLRESTERPEAVIHGFAKVVGTNPVVVLAEIEKALAEDPNSLPAESPFGDGKASKRIVDHIVARLGA